MFFRLVRGWSGCQPTGLSPQSSRLFHGTVTSLVFLAVDSLGAGVKGDGSDWPIHGEKGDLIPRA